MSAREPRRRVPQRGEPRARLPVKRDLLGRFARSTSRTVGHATAFVAAVIVVATWAVTGPYFHYSDTWQLVINTGTTVVTFLMVFLIQQTQNRDSEAMHVKLDEIIRALRGAHNDLLDIEDLTEEELDALRATYAVLARSARRATAMAADHGAASRAELLLRDP